MHATTVALGICMGKPTEARLARERARVDGRDATWTCRRGFQAGADLGGGSGGDCAPGVQSGTQTSENKAPWKPSTCAMRSAYACGAEFNAGADWAVGSGVLRPRGLNHVYSPMQTW